MKDGIKEALQKRLVVNGKRLTPLKAIRLKCLDCMSNHPKEVRLCQSEECPLYFYRFGKNPLRKGIGGRIVNKKTRLS